MPINFNVDPWYDDFDQTKNFHRILFKPGRAVQARELTQAQTILQDQITKFADNIFKQNSPVSGGNVTVNLKNNYLKLQTSYNNVNIDVTKFKGLMIKNADGSVVARVVKAIAATAGDAPTLVLNYRTGTHFSDNDVIYDVSSNLAAQAIPTGATGDASTTSISQGVFYILGNFVQIQDDTVVLDKYGITPNARIGLTINETWYDYIDDPSLLDPAIGASNYQAPGADRYVIAISLDTRPLQFGDDDNFVELVRVVNGEVQKLVDGSVYNVIDDYFAKRDYETNGDYVVTDFKLTTRTNPNDVVGDTANGTYIMSVGKGLAYVHGYRTENATQVDLVSPRARTTDSQTNNPIYVNYGNYFYVDTLHGKSNTFFDFTTTQPVDLHCVTVANINSTNAATYNATTVATGYLRDITYDHYTSTADANTYVYKAFVHDVQAKTMTGTAASGGTATIVLPGTFSSVDGAYVGVNITLTGGPSAGDVRTITSYTGSTRTATVGVNWTTSPTSSTTFALNFGIKDAEVLVAKTSSSNYTLIGSSNINVASRSNGLSSGTTVLENTDSPELLFPMGSPYVASASGASYTTTMLFRNVGFGSSGGYSTAAINFESFIVAGKLLFKHLGALGTTQTDDTVRSQYTIIVTDRKTNTNINNGDIILWEQALSRTVDLDVDGSIATFKALASGGNALAPFTADIIAKVYVQDADNTSYVLKYKNLITANSATVVGTSGTQVNTYTYVDDTTLNSKGQVYIQNPGLVTPGSAQSLYLSDVKRIVKIVDSKIANTAPTVANLTDPTHDITTNYNFFNGQKDSYYDHATITLKPGAPQPTGDIVVLLDYYQHAGGDGYFSISSYIGSSKEESYQQIPTYKATNGTLYSLRDCVDFRPARLNAQSSFVWRYSNLEATNGILLPVDGQLYENNYSYYLGRKDKLVLTKDRQFQIVEGAPSLTPIAPSEPDGSLVLANLTHRPYTGYIPTEAPIGTVSDLSVDKVQHKRYTMQDISNIEGRINNIEYYTSLNLLEQKTTSLQITDSYGLNRFKNGIMTDDFSSFATADTLNGDFSFNINRREHTATAPQVVTNFPLKSTALTNNMGSLSDAAQTTLGFAINTDGSSNYFTLPYTTANVASQKFASRTVNVNPFSYSTTEGALSISPNMDNWVDTNYAPKQLVIDPTLNLYTQSPKAQYMYTDYKAIPGTITSSKYVVGHGINPSPYGYVGYNEVDTYTQATATSYSGFYGSNYAVTNNYVTDISILPFIRPQQIVVRGYDMLHNASIDAYFDGTNVDNYVRKTNVIELTGVTGTFSENDTIGYYSGSNFVVTGRVVGVYNKTSTTVRLYVAADPYSTKYTSTAGDVGGTLYSATFPANGDASQTTQVAHGTVASTSHFGGRVTNVDGTGTLIKLSGLAPTSANNFYGNGSNTIYFASGSAAGESAVITNYYTANQTLRLAASVTAANGDIYSIGSFNTDETGSFYGIFNLPANTFHNGQRTFRLDNSNGNAGAATTYSESTFYAEGLQTTQVSQTLAASPSAVKDIWVSGTKTVNQLISSTTSPWDPVAQTFMVSKQNYPNGLFLSSISVFFKTKPLVDTAPITLSILETLNGYPTNSTVNNSVVTLQPSQVKYSTTPQYLDATTKTTFTFNAPVYIQPETLYAFMLKSKSDEYVLHSAASGDTALDSSTTNVPGGTVNKTKLSGAPYVGGLFTSQNSQTWSVDQNQALMFVIDGCVFSTSTATMAFAIPNKLPQRTLIDQSVQYYLNANNISSAIDTVTNSDMLVDAFNITTTDMVPTSTGISYSYNATLQNGSAAGMTNINPGKFGTPSQEEIYLNDGSGERLLMANSNNSFLLYASVTTTDPYVSPIISDSGLSAYAIQWQINNCQLSNSSFTITNGGASYGTGNTVVTFSAPTGKNGTQAYGGANVANGVVTGVYVTTPGSGYITTPTVSITTSSGSGAGATATVAGETSKNGGNALSRYVSKKVVLSQGFDSGDLNVYISAYRPVNTDIHVYYKILSGSDNQKFEDGTWQLMTKTNNCDALYSQTRDEINEYTFAPGTSGTDQGFVSYTSTNGNTYTNFNQFAIKIVLTTSDNTYVPVLQDMRTIALPANVNTTF